MGKLKVIIQGEVIVRELEKLPKDLPEESTDRIVAYGETGNAHVLEGGKFNLYGNFKAAEKYLRVEKRTSLKHGFSDSTQGHETVIIEPGVYEIIPQVELDLVQKVSRNVAD